MRLSKLRQVRELRLMTQEELAALTGITRATLSRLEARNAHARISTVRKLTAALNVDVSVLIGDTPLLGGAETALDRWESEGGSLYPQSRVRPGE
jgi:transcriptional regulator with XRE-family HTH domain